MEDRIRQFEVLCRQRGLPLTVQRRQIFEAVLGRNDHPTADQVYESVKDRVPGLSRTTVYRVLDALVTLGVIRRVHHPGASARYDGKIRRHHHLVCGQCHKVLDLDDAALSALPLPQQGLQGFEIDDYVVQFVGTCAQCKREAQ